MEKINDILKDKWGFDSFRPLQSDIINSVLKDQDTLAILPTGGGKSICFQIPALAREGICLVVSPLIALMRDQVENLKKKNIPSLTLFSGLGYIEVKKILQNAAFGNFKFLYVSPERLESDLFLEYLPSLPINLIAVDEAHCVSQWGYDFRPPYLRVAAIRKHFPLVPVLALTASATKEVRYDIIEKLAFRSEHKVFRQSFSRPNLSYSLFSPSSKENKVIQIFNSVKGSGIIYCKSRSKTKEISDLLNASGIISSYYHAGLSSEMRSKTQLDWINNKIRVITCTNAFGMGIDKGDVSAVVHFDVPESLESYYQEAGRAGRDGSKAYAVLLSRGKDTQDLLKQIDIKFPDNKTVIKTYKAVVNYLQLPVESGEGKYFDFDLKDFCEKFKFNAKAASYSLKILQQEDIIALTEEIFLPSKVVFTCTKEDLLAFETIYPDLNVLIKGLLRSYHGIFDFPVAISTKQLSSFIHLKEEDILNQLIFLNSLRIIQYEPSKTLPQIQFLKNRVRVEDLSINNEAVLKRKEAFSIRTNEMIHYIKDVESCRSKLIGNYFDDFEIGDCGICDNCIKRNKKDISNFDIESIFELLLNHTEDAISVDDLLTRGAFKKDKIWKILDFLVAEQRISIDKNGKVNSKKKGPR